MAIAFRSIDISEETRSEIGNAWNLDPAALLRKLMSGSIPGHWRAHQLEAEAKPYLIAPDDIERCVTQFNFLNSPYIYQGNNGICVFRVPFCNKEFVIKARFSKLGAEEQEYIKLRNEATFMKKCRHPYAVALLGYWEFIRAEGLSELTSVPLLLMESMECDLDSIIKGNKSRWWPWGGTGGFPALEAINLVLPVAKVMKYLHGIGVVHLDLKPKNILFTRVPGKRGHPEVVSVKLADFGEAQMAKDELINVGGKFGRVGTPGYMHPVVWYQVESVDLFQADIFSIGMVLGEVLTGVSSMEALGCKLGKEFYIKLQGEQVQLPEDTPTSVKSIVENCLKLNPDERPSFAHICRELEEAEIELRNGGPCKHSEVST